jgi:hypothetical protein
MIITGANTLSTWLCTPTQFDAMPIGTQFSMLAARTDLGGVFAGKMTILVLDASILDLLNTGFEVAPEIFADGQPVYVQGQTLVSWQTKEFIDPCAGISDVDLLRSCVMRGLI